VVEDEADAATFGVTAYIPSPQSVGGLVHENDPTNRLVMFRVLLMNDPLATGDADVNRSGESSVTS